jgi:3-oxoadipate enol-lactonase
MDYYAFNKTVLYGVSMGSYIAQGAAIAQPQRVNKLILTVPKANGLTSSTRKLFMDHAQELAMMNKKERLMFLYKNMAYNPEILIRNPAFLRSTLTPQQSQAANKALEGFDFRSALPKITADTLVISGKYDGLNPPAAGKLCASLIPNSTYVEMQYSGHLPMLEEPETYRKIVDGFLADTL